MLESENMRSWQNKVRTCTSLQLILLQNRTVKNIFYSSFVDTCGKKMLQLKKPKELLEFYVQVQKMTSRGCNRYLIKFKVIFH